MLRGDHRRNGFAIHDTTEWDRLRVGLPVIHAAAHVGVEGQITAFEQDLPSTWRRDGGFLKAEVGQLGLPLRSGSKDDVAGLCFGHIDTSIARVEWMPYGKNSVSTADDDARKRRRINQQRLTSHHHTAEGTVFAQIA